MKHIVAFFALIPLFIQAQIHHRIFPEPKQYLEFPGKLDLPDTLRITDNFESQNLQRRLAGVFGSHHFEYTSQKNAFIQLSANEHFGQEEYAIEINASGIHIQYKETKGLFYAFQSLDQLRTENSFPFVQISDAPAYGYRGAHLDCSRHFFTVNEIQLLLDEMAYLKFNTFHWHLTDDQGWRIEIKKYPKLTEIGAWRDSTLIGHYRDQPWKFEKKRTGGFYTQQDVQTIVTYAAKLGIDVIPEIELPGHARAALAAYPALGCTGKKYPVASTWGVFDEVFCSNEATLDFLKNVLTEVAQLFPSKYIHIGGDEVPKVQWNNCEVCQNNIAKHGLKDGHGLQSYIITSIEKHLNSLGKSIIGWDEILEGGLVPNATVMSWRGMEGGQAAAALKHPVIMTPTTYCYFDYYQSSHPNEPLSIGGYLPLEKVYQFNPIEGVSEENQSFILGGQANLWTEYIGSFQQVCYQEFPRLVAMAEVLWNRSALKYPAFVDGMVKYYVPHLNHMKLNYSNAYLDPLMRFTAVSDGIALHCEKTLENAATTINGQKDGQFVVNASDQPKEVTIEVTSSYADAARTLDYTLHTHYGLGKPVVFTTTPHPKYNQHGNLGLTDGIIGSRPWKGSEWLGFEEDTVVFELNLPTETDLLELSIYFLNDPASWIYLPEKMIVTCISKNGKKKVLRLNTLNEKTTIKRLKKVETLRFTVINKTQIPSGQPGAGFTPWTFISEIQLTR
jgi:hexosaminidase